MQAGGKWPRPCRCVCTACTTRIPHLPANPSLKPCARSETSTNLPLCLQLHNKAVVTDFSRPWSQTRPRLLSRVIDVPDHIRNDKNRQRPTMRLRCVCHQNEVLAAGIAFSSQTQTVQAPIGDVPLGHILISYFSVLRGQCPTVQEGLDCVLLQVCLGCLFCVPHEFVQTCPQR